MSDKKVVVETTGNFLLLDPTTGECVEAEGFTEVTNSNFIQSKLEDGQLALKPAPAKAVSK